MRMAEEDAQTRRDHYKRSGSATEYDALHGLGSYGRKSRAGLQSIIQLLPGRAQSELPTNRAGTPHPW